MMKMMTEYNDKQFSTNNIEQLIFTLCIMNISTVHGSAIYALRGHQLHRDIPEALLMTEDATGTLTPCRPTYKNKNTASSSNRNSINKLRKLI